MGYNLQQRSLDRLQGVDPKLVTLVKRAIQIQAVDFMVVEGLRTKERQKELFAKGATKTLNSKHIVGRAVDLAPLVDGAIPWNDQSKFTLIAKAMFQAQKETGTKIRWGADWNQNGRTDDERFVDQPHFELI